MHFEELLESLSADVVVRGRQFERLCRWFLERDRRYSFEKIWLWDEWPGRWGPDCGIDLVAVDRVGRTWAIQAKCYAPTTTVAKADIDSFLSESNRSQFDVRLLIASTNLIGRNASRVMKGQEKPVHQILRSDLEAAQLDWPDDVDALVGGGPLPPKKPWPYQREAIDAVVAGFESNDRGQLVMACGTGKTLTALWVVEAMGAERTLVLVPSLALLSQTVSEWTAADSRGMEYLPVCSDESVTSDSFTGAVSELGYPVTTDADDIAAFMSGPGPLVVFSTYQSSPQIAVAMEQRGVAGFDLVVADEAHRCAGKVSTAFGTVLDPDKIRSQQRLFMTATPRVYAESVRKKAEAADIEVASMDDSTTFGPLFHQLSFGEAIERDLLTNYQVAVIGVDDATYRQWADNAELVTTETGIGTDARSLAGQIGLAKAIKQYDLQRVITFHNRIDTAEHFAQTLPAVVDWMPETDRPTRKLNTNFVSGKMSTGQRITRLDRLRHQEPNEVGILSNARCLSEGVDVPTLDGVAFIDPKGSQVDIVQAVGRAIRKADNKTIGTIVIPVFIDTDQDPEQALASSAFEPIWSVLKALRSHDEALGHELDQLRYRLGRHPQTKPVRPQRIIFDVPMGITTKFADAFDIALINETTASWDYWYGLLEAFIEREGHAKPAALWMEGDFALGTWVAAQRGLRKKRELETERFDRLKSLPGWSWDLQADAWEVGYQALQVFIDREGHAKPAGLWMEGDFPLGKWVHRQRKLRKNGKLETERFDRLKSLPGWSWDSQADGWEDGYQALQAFIDREGHAKPAQGSMEGDFPLGKWVAKQRELGKGGKLDAERFKRLKSLPGWSWDSQADGWEVGYQALQAFIEREGHAKPAQGSKVGDFALGKWVHRQRVAGKSGKLDAERFKRLKSLPGWSWDPHADAWEVGYQALQVFIKREGHAKPAKSLMEGDFPLGKWVAKQRELGKGGKLDAERFKRLKSLPGWSWDPHADAWEVGYRALQVFIDREGHAKPAQGLMEGDFPLGEWVGRQRKLRKGGKLDAERFKRLKSLPGWSWGRQADAWEA